MEFKWFIFVLLLSTALSIALTIWKMFSYKNGWRLSWFAVPLPFLLGVAFVAAPYLYAVIQWHR